jgi:hypothetical protein
VFSIELLLSDLHDAFEDVGSWSLASSSGNAVISQVL